MVGAMIVVGFHLLGGATAARGIDPIRGLPFSRIYSLEDVGYVPRDSRLNFDSFGRVAVIHEGVYAVLNDTAWANLYNLDDPAHYPISEVVYTGNGRSFYCGRASWGWLAELCEQPAMAAAPLTATKSAGGWKRRSTIGPTAARLVEVPA